MQLKNKKVLYWLTLSEGIFLEFIANYFKIVIQSENGSNLSLLFLISTLKTIFSFIFFQLFYRQHIKTQW